MYFVVTFLLLFGIWVSFSGLLDAFHLTLGVISCVIVSVISTRVLFPKPETPISTQLSRILPFIGYCFWLFKEIVVANIHVLYLAIFPGAMKHLEPEIVSMKIRLKNDSARYLLANSITLTPGTVTVKIDGDDLMVHSISRKTTKGLEGGMEKRIAAIFGEKIEN